MVKRKSDSPKKGGRVTSAKQNKPKKKTVNVLQDIANLQNTTNLLIPRAPFLRVVFIDSSKIFLLLFILNLNHLFTRLEK